MINTLLIANRGEIALRIMRSARRLGMRTVAVYSDADRDAPHVRGADLAVRIGAPAPRASYLDIAAILDAARRAGADAVHPGYGFLAENADFARACVAAGLIFVGPPAAAIAAMGDKARAKQRMRAAGIPCIPGYDGDDLSAAKLSDEARRIGFPLMIKASAGGGGRGMRLVHDAAHLDATLASARSEAGNAFGDDRVILERALIKPRHIEIQVFADAHGNVIHLGERDCSIQRRHQKIIEEAPSPAVDAALRARMGAAAVEVARNIDYRGAGTIEFLLDTDSGAFFFMEMNTRLQVEHPVTEAVTGLDLVEMQLRVAGGESLAAMLPRLQDDVRCDGHAIEARLCAEDPGHDFLPETGTLALWRAPDGVRADHGLESGLVISPWYDSMLAKLITHAPTRAAAARQLADGLEHCVALGLSTNRAFLARVLRHPAFVAGDTSTAFIADHFGSDALRASTPTPQDWALAAVIAASVEPVSDARIPRGLRDWSSSGARERGVRLACGTVERRAVVSSDCAHRDTVRFDDDDVAITIQSDAGLQAGIVQAVVIDGVTRAVCHVRIADARLSRIAVQVDGRDASFIDRSRDAAVSADDAARAGTLSAPLNGRVVQVGVQNGDVVAAGTVLMVLEAMKMEHPIVARIAGVVSELTAAVGDQVAPGRVLARIDAVTAVPA